MLLTTLENTLAASLANPALSDGNRPMYIGLGTSEVASSLSDTTLSADHIVTEIDSISVSGSKTTILWKLPYESGNDIPSPIREIGVYTKGGDLIVRKEFPLTDKMNMTRIYGKIVVDLPILAMQNGVDSTIDPCISLTGEVGTVVGDTTLDPGESAYFAVSFPSGNYEVLAYTGTLEFVEASGNGAILRMPEGATGTYTASWTASCGRSASMTVAAIVSGACTGGSCYSNIPGTKSPGDVVCVCGRWARLGASVLGNNLCWWTATGPIFWFAGGGRWVQCSTQNSPWRSYTVL